MFQVASQIEALYTIRLRWDLPFSTSELGSWITPHLEAKLSLEGYYESLELLEKQKEILPVHTTVSETAANKVITELVTF
ncbi:hypothetical protein HMI55_005419 [Coelomomyces lativittatus]|nr:hypothetical protein HMI55_005419 [Coelomomyces lativittatus]